MAKGKKVQWSNIELNILKTEGANTPNKTLLAKLNGKTDQQLRVKLSKLGIKKSYLKEAEHWTKYEERLLEDFYHLYTNKELVKKFFPNRKPHHIYCKAMAMGLSKCDNSYKLLNSDKQLLLGLYLTDLSLKEIGEKFGITESHTRRVCHGLLNQAFKTGHISEIQYLTVLTVRSQSIKDRFKALEELKKLMENTYARYNQELEIC